MKRAVIVVASALGFALPPHPAAAAPREAVARAERAPVPKPSGPLDMAYRVAGTPRVGAAVDIEVTVRGVALEAPRLEALLGDAALAVVSLSAAVAHADGFSWRVTVVPLAAAAAYVTLVATARIEGAEQSRSVVVPIRTAAELRAPTAGAVMTADGERLVVMPAEEPATPR